jgi:hypothetical protein
MTISATGRPPFRRSFCLRLSRDVERVFNPSRKDIERRKLARVRLDK